MSIGKMGYKLVRLVDSVVLAVFHRPHPQKETDKGALVSLRKFLENADVTPKEEKKHDEIQRIYRAGRIRR